MSASPLPTNAAPRITLRGDALLPVKGRLTRITGTILRSTIAEVRVGEQCLIRDPFTGGETLADVWLVFD